MTLSTIAPSDFTRLIKQANLKLTAKEAKAIRAQLGEALEAVQVLKELDTSKILETSSASGLVNVLREDVIETSFSQEEALQNAKDVHNGYFVVPAIFATSNN